KDRYVEARELNRIQNYIELKLKEAKHIVTEAPPTVQYEEEQTNEELSEVNLLCAGSSKFSHPSYI
ncbi:unnamed protein product, partial [Rotaria magnacalcarata]